MDKIVSIYGIFVRFMSILSAFFICVMMMVTVVDIVMRAVLNDSLTGSTEIVSMSMVCVVYFGVGYTTFKRGMITVDIFKVPFVIVFINNILSLVTGVLLVLALVQQAAVAFTRGGGTLRLHIPNWPFEYITAFGFVVMIISLLICMREDFQLKKKGINIGSYVEGDIIDDDPNEIPDEEFIKEEGA